MTQGKLVSQMVTYIWRWADDDNLKGKYARQLKACFDRTHRRLTPEMKAKLSPEQSYELETLLTVDARKFLIATQDDDQLTLKQFSLEQKHAAQLLIQVFGEQRIKNLENYLSPIFNPDAVDMGDKEDYPYPVYQFFIDPNSFTGTLEDPNLEESLAFRYMVSYPPAPKISKSTVTAEELENWAEDKNEKLFRPVNPYIPVSTS